MLSLVALTGAEFVDALLRGGFAVQRREDSLTVLARGEKTVVVCETAMLSADDLVYLLRRAGVAYFELLDLLAAGKTATPDPKKKSGFHRRTEAGGAARSREELVAKARSSRRR